MMLPFWSAILIFREVSPPFLTLPVQRCLVPTPSMKGELGGGGLSRPSMISKTEDFTNFNLGRP